MVRFVAEQLGIDDEHFAAGGAELREFLTARVWSSLEGPRALFDRAVVRLVNNRVLLPGVTTLARMVTAVRQEENDRPHASLYEAVPSGLRTEMIRLQQLAEALATIAAVVPGADGDDDAKWRVELVARHGTARGFIRLLVEVIDFGAVEAGAPVMKALKGLPEPIARLSPLQYDHINFLGRYAFSRPAAPGLRQLRDPHSEDKNASRQRFGQTGTSRTG
ncbi:DUF4158 domain-containing protein [Streptomyces triculaminicus]|uniref:DUF4158 domain-containing protein n=1 Tax=Streptomyces triculaminicus TaxID=2816232 RepID=UPI00340237BB